MKHAPEPSTADLDFFFDEDHHAIAEKAARFASEWTLDDQRDEDEATLKAVSQLTQAGLTQYCVPERFGGAAIGRPDGLDTRALTLIRESLGWSDALLDTAFAMQGLGSYPITLAGTTQQKQTYLPAVLAGQSLGAFALTEPNAGSDVASMSCLAEASGDSYIVNGQKTYISNAGIAGQYVLFAKTHPEKGRRGMSAFIIEPDDPGLSVERFEVIAPHPIGTLIFDNCRIPKNRLLGQEGDGFKIAMGTLDVFRTTVAGAAIGMAQRALDEGLHRALERTQFGKPIFEQQQIMAYLADSATELTAARLLVFRAAYRRDLSTDRVSSEVAMGKLFATEAAQRIIDRAVQIFGGLGVTRGVAVERLYREIRALRIYEGTSEIQKVVIGAHLRKLAASTD
ncbi:MAG: acyl-CoA dehydrogenase family protein [Myxococcota bacterium]|nr:acyl-CoA dehydrogenase family protein [Myxococcota bacterium]